MFHGAFHPKWIVRNVSVLLPGTYQIRVVVSWPAYLNCLSGAQTSFHVGSEEIEKELVKLKEDLLQHSNSMAQQDLKT